MARQVEMLTKGSILVTSSSWYGNDTRVRTRQLAPIADKTFQIVKRYLHLPSDCKVVIGRIRSNHILGQYFSDKKEAWVDPRSDNISKMIDTICHELVHANQYHSGMLKQGHEPTFHWEWDNKKFKNTTKHYIYHNWPWEIDARERGAWLAAIVYKELGYTS
jgi:hypothetical protein